MKWLRPIFVVMAVLGAWAGRTALAQPASASRILHAFDFEERRLGNHEDLPMHWQRVWGPGLPHYVNGRLTTDAAHTGHYSFQIDLDGGSAVYRYDTGRLPVKVGAHYRFEGFCRTTPLLYARARLSAYFVDVDGHPLPRAASHSHLYGASAPGEPWTLLSTELTADDPKAASIVVEMALLQPELYAVPGANRPVVWPQDVRGSAWFDDLLVAQVPQVTLATDRPANVFRQGDALQLHVRVNDPFTDDLAARLIVTDATGQPAYQRTGLLDRAQLATIGPDEKQMTLTLPAMPAGWYSASLVVSSQGEYLGARQIDFIQLADNGPIDAAPDKRIGVAMRQVADGGWDSLPDVLSLLGVGRAKVPVWTSTVGIEQLPTGTFDRLLDALQHRGITPTACLIDLPPPIASRLRQPMFNLGPLSKADGTSTAWPLLRNDDPAVWQPPLAYLLARHGTHLDHWQLGADNSDEFVTVPGMRQVYAMVYQQFAGLMDHPDLAMPWPAWYELDGRLPASVALGVPSSVLPNQINLYLDDALGRRGERPARQVPANSRRPAISLSLEPLPEPTYGREVRLRDFVQRSVYALAAGAEHVDWPMPLKVLDASNGDTSAQPQELFMLERTLATTLGHATYRGRVPLAEGVESLLFDRGGEGVLVLWNPSVSAGRDPGADVKTLAVNLGDNPRCVDAWGRTRPLLRPNNEADGQRVTLTVGPMPMYLVDIDAPLAQLRAGVSIDNPLVESSFEPHARKIRFTNPYPMAISGQVKLKGPPGWSITPPVLPFNLNPGEQFERDITIEFPYNSYAGPKDVESQFTLQADRPQLFTVPLTLQLGLSDVGLQTMAVRDGNRLVVQQMISNYGEKPINYTAFAVVPGQSRQERILTNIAPGQVLLKRYQFDGIRVPVGAIVRSGLRETDGMRILNDEVAVQ